MQFSRSLRFPRPQGGEDKGEGAATGEILGTSRAKVRLVPRQVTLRASRAARLRGCQARKRLPDGTHARCQVAV